MDIANCIYEVGYRIAGADPKNDLPHHDDSIEIIQTWSDGGFFIVKNNIFPIKPGTLLLIDATNTHFSNPADLTQYSRSKVILASNFFRQLLSMCGMESYFNQKLASSGGIALHLPPYETAAKKVDGLLKAIAELSPDDPFRQLHIMSSLIQILEQIATAPAPPSITHNLRSIDLLTRYINDHLDNLEDIRMVDIAESLHISQSRASHLFKELYGKTLTQYATDLRIAKAKKLLLSTQMKIKDISDALDFHNPTIFCKYFKKYAGCTPRRYRDSNGISIKLPDA